MILIIIEAPAVQGLPMVVVDVVQYLLVVGANAGTCFRTDNTVNNTGMQDNRGNVRMTFTLAWGHIAITQTTLVTYERPRNFVGDCTSRILLFMLHTGLLHLSTTWTQMCTNKIGAPM